MFSEVVALELVEAGRIQSREGAERAIGFKSLPTALGTLRSMISIVRIFYELHDGCGAKYIQHFQ